MFISRLSGQDVAHEPENRKAKGNLPYEWIGELEKELNDIWRHMVDGDGFDAGK
jgi:hypothetical protein